VAARSRDFQRPLGGRLAAHLGEVAGGERGGGEERGGVEAVVDLFSSSSMTVTFENHMLDFASNSAGNGVATDSTSPQPMWVLRRQEIIVIVR